MNKYIYKKKKRATTKKGKKNEHGHQHEQDRRPIHFSIRPSMLFGKDKSLFFSFPSPHVITTVNVCAV